MKLTNRFALLAVVGAILCSAMMVGCGGGDEETPATNNVTNNSTNRMEDDE